MVPSKQSYPGGVAHFEGEQITHHLNTVMASINVVPHKQIAGIRDISADQKQFLQVVELTVNISADHHRGFDDHHVAFFEEDFFGFGKQDAQIAQAQLLALLEEFDHLVDFPFGFRGGAGVGVHLRVAVNLMDQNYS